MRNFARIYFVFNNEAKLHRSFFVYGINLIFVKVLIHLSLIMTTYFNLKS